MALIPEILDQVVARLEITSAWGPPIEIDDPFRQTAAGAAGAAPAASASGFDLARFLQPKIAVYQRSGGDPITFTPYGDPGESKWPWVAAGLGVLIGTLTWAAFRKCRR